MASHMIETGNIQWKSHEYRPQERSRDWYWAVGIVALSLSATAVLLGNTLFGVFIVLATATLLLFAKRKPRVMSCEISGRGVKIGRQFYAFDALESFCVEDGEGDDKIIFKYKSAYRPFLIVPLDEVEPESVREHLRGYLAEEKHEEPLGQKIMEFLGF